MDKSSELVKKVKKWVDDQYDDGRVTVIADNELVEIINKTCEELGITINKG